MSQNNDNIYLFFLGISNAGKTALIQSISEIDVVSVKRPVTGYGTIAVDFGRLSIPDTPIMLYFFGEPGARPLPLAAPLFQGIQRPFGICFVGDSAKNRHYIWEFPHEDIYYATIACLRDVQTTPYPYIVLASKQDRDGARSPDELRTILGIPEDIPVLPTSTKTEFCRPVIRQAKKAVEAADMIHVEMREKHMFNCLNLGNSKHIQTAIAAVKQQPIHTLPAIDADKRCIIASGFSQNSKR